MGYHDGVINGIKIKASLIIITLSSLLGRDYLFILNRNIMVAIMFVIAEAYKD